MRRSARNLILTLAIALLSVGPLLAEAESAVGWRSGPAVVPDSLRSIPESLRGVLEEEFRGFLARGLVRPHHVSTRDGEDLYRSFLRLFDEKGPGIGDEAPDVALWDLDTRKMVRVREITGNVPLLLVFGSYSCPVFRNGLNDLERLAEVHRGQLRVVIVYTLEAHPIDENPYVRGVWLSQVNEAMGLRIRQHRSMQERLAVAGNPPEGLKTSIKVLVDPMEEIETVDKLADIGSSNPANNPAWKAFGLLPNSAFLIDTSGRIAFRMASFSSDPTLLANIWQLQNETRYPKGEVCYLHAGEKKGAESASCTP